jgi:hypothetical protein
MMRAFPIAAITLAGLLLSSIGAHADSSTNANASMVRIIRTLGRVPQLLSRIVPARDCNHRQQGSLRATINSLAIVLAPFTRSRLSSCSTEDRP